MDSSALYEQLISKLQLKSEATQVIICLEDFLASFFVSKTNADFSQFVETVRPEIAHILTEALAKVSKSDASTVKKMLTEVEQKLRTSPVVQLTLAFQPDQDMLTFFSENFKQQTDPHMLLELHYDKAIVGGALLIYNGKYKDYSLRKKLNDRFRIQKDEIMGMLR